MNREIKFRAKPLKGGYPWVYGNAVLQVKGKAYLLEDNEAEVIPDFDRESSFYTVDGLIEVDTKTIGQYTGLKDKKGKEIYEGDIVSIGNNLKAVVIWFNGSFRFKDELSCKATYFEDMGVMMRDYDVCIIGNIYDNHELLKGGDE